MRLFAAIDIEPQVLERIRQVQKCLREKTKLSGPEVKWVRPEQIHLTLKFLGEVRDEAIRAVCDVVTRTASRHEAFEFEVKGAGVFGRPARVVWAGMSPCPVLTALQRDLEAEFEKIGWPKENRAFTGHLTLCRVKSASAGNKLAAAIQEHENEVFGSVCADEVVLYDSKLSAGGPQYTAVCTGPLK